MTDINAPKWASSEIYARRPNEHHSLSFSYIFLYIPEMIKGPNYIGWRATFGLWTAYSEPLIVVCQMDNFLGRSEPERLPVLQYLRCTHCWYSKCTQDWWTLNPVWQWDHLFRFCTYQQVHLQGCSRGGVVGKRAGSLNPQSEIQPPWFPNEMTYCALVYEELPIRAPVSTSEHFRKSS